MIKRLIIPCFIPSIQRLLISRRVLVTDFRVHVVVETLLHELRSVKKIYDALSIVYENLTGQDPVKIKQLRIVGDCYTGAG